MSGATNCSSDQIMDDTRQKRQSCELCRKRKLKCSGELSGCLRCLKLSLPCVFVDKGSPGRPRKRPDEVPRKRQRRQRHHEINPEIQNPSPPEDDFQALLAESPLYDAPSTAMSLSMPSLTGSESSVANESCRDFCSFVPEMTGQDQTMFCGLPNDWMSSWGSPPSLNDNTKDIFSHGLLHQMNGAPSCDCTESVTDIIRTFKRSPLSHDILRNLRMAADICERVLSCPVCYDTSKPPRITIQNVFLVGRLMFEITSAYHRYLRWLKDTADTPQSETVYLIPGLEISPVLGFKVSAKMLQDIIRHGIQHDIHRISDLGRSFSKRQQDRHMAGHEACSESGDYCQKEDSEGGLDPSEVCPQTSAAQSLIPCFRIVSDVQKAIVKVADAIQDGGSASESS